MKPSQTEPSTLADPCFKRPGRWTTRPSGPVLFGQGRRTLAIDRARVPRPHARKVRGHRDGAREPHTPRSGRFRTNAQAAAERTDAASNSSSRSEVSGSMASTRARVPTTSAAFRKRPARFELRERRILEPGLPVRGSRGAATRSSQGWSTRAPRQARARAQRVPCDSTGRRPGRCRSQRPSREVAPRHRRGSPPCARSSSS